MSVDRGERGQALGTRSTFSDQGTATGGRREENGPPRAQVKEGAMHCHR